MNYTYKVLGIKRLDFINDAGTHVNGYQLWVCAATADPSWIGGLEVFKCWIPFENPLFGTVGQLRTGDDITGECDRHGRPISINKK